jgi:hypothetical protein
MDGLLQQKRALSHGKRFMTSALLDEGRKPSSGQWGWLLHFEDD